MHRSDDTQTGAPRRAHPGNAEISFGEELRRERELRGIELAEIAEGTKVSLRLLRALESNSFDELPGGLFTRGFIRAYANHIGADPDRLVNAYLMQLSRLAEEESGEAHSGPRLETGVESPPPRSRVRAVAVVLVLLVLAVIGTGAILWLRRGPAAEPEPVPIPVQAPAAAERVLEIRATGDNRVQVTCNGEIRMDRPLRAGDVAEVGCAGDLRLDASSAGDLELTLDGAVLGRPGEPGSLLLGWTPPADAPPA